MTGTLTGTPHSYPPVVPLIVPILNVNKLKHGGLRTAPSLSSPQGTEPGFEAWQSGLRESLARKHCPTGLESSSSRIPEPLARAVQVVSLSPDLAFIPANEFPFMLDLLEMD